MSLRSVEMWQVVCDGCGSVAQECKFSEYWAWADTDSAISDAEAGHGWLIQSGQAFCPDDIEYDEEADEYRPKVRV